MNGKLNLSKTKSGNKIRFDHNQLRRPACKLPQVRNMVDVLTSVYNFFYQDPKRHILEYIMMYIEESESAKEKAGRSFYGPWVERHFCFHFIPLLSNILFCFDFFSVRNTYSWHSKTVDSDLSKERHAYL